MQNLEIQDLSFKSNENENKKILHGFVSRMLRHWYSNTRVRWGKTWYLGSSLFDRIKKDNKQCTKYYELWKCSRRV